MAGTQDQACAVAARGRRLNLGETVDLSRVYGDERQVSLVINFPQIVDIARVSGAAPRPRGPAPCPPMGTVTRLKQAPMEAPLGRAPLTYRIREALAVALAPLSAPEVAERLGEPPERVKSTLHQLATHGDAKSIGVYGAAVYVISTQGLAKARGGT